MGEAERPSEAGAAARVAAAWSDPDGIETLVTRWAGVIRAAAGRYRIADAEMDELVQEVRLRLWRATRRGSAPVAPAGYVYRAAISAAIDMVRRRRTAERRQHVAVEDLGDQLADRSGRVEQSEERLVAALERALARVTASRRPAVRLHLAGRSLDEITHVMGWSPARARNLLYRGLEELRRQIEEEAGE